MPMNPDSETSQPGHEFKPAVDPAELRAEQPDFETPPGFQFNPDNLGSYEEQIEFYKAQLDYQQRPNPSFENVPRANVTPTLNPTHAPAELIYARNLMPNSMRPSLAPHSEHIRDSSPVEMWRVVERSKVVDGTGLVSSHVLLDNTLGDVENFDDVKHFASDDKRRTGNPSSATPFVSFSTDPVYLADRLILAHGFGLKDGRDSVVVRVQADPGRFITSGRRKEEEVLLLGGVAPSEYVAAYEISDFVANALPPEAEINIEGVNYHRDEAFRHWREGLTQA